MRICIAPTDIASYYTGLKQGFADIGHQAWFFAFDRNPYSRYCPGREDPLLERVVFWASGMSRPKGMGLWLWYRPMKLMLRALILLFAMFRCDVFVFGFGMTFFNRMELPLLGFLRKRMIFVFNGSDSRPAWMSGIAIHGTQAVTPAQAVELVRRQSRRIRWIERYATECIVHPLSAHLHRRRFINHLIIGHPCATIPVVSSDPKEAFLAQPVRIVHAPTRPAHKGSDRIRSAIEQLRGEGIEIDFVELIGRPNEEVLRAIASCDLVIDELYSDIPLAGLGTEAACAGKPTIVGGYGAQEIGRYLSSSGFPTELFIHPDHLLEVVRRLAVDRGERERLGAIAEHFVRLHWRPALVAGRFCQIIRRQVPRSWYVDPAGLRYWQGWGSSQAQTIDFLARIVRQHGVASLQIRHNPILEAELSRIAHGGRERL